MPAYRNLPPEELAANLSFRRWTLYDAPADKTFWEEWLELNPDQKDRVSKAQQLLATTFTSFDHISDEEIAGEIYRLSHAIGENNGKRTWLFLMLRPQWYSIAASVLILISMGWWFTKKNKVQNDSAKVYKEIISQIKEPLKVQENLTSKPKLLILEDGSSILLQPNSRITFPENFSGSRREVFLSGEAFFEVAKNPDKPFYVYANTLATKVLGTSFKVTAFDNEKDVKVVVKTGKVSVFAISGDALATQHADNKLGGMVLTPNQQILYSPVALRLTRSLVEDPALLELPIQSQSFVFKGTPINEVFEALEKSYGIKIVYDSEVMKNCFLTASLSDEPLFEKIDLICKTIGAKYEQMDASIIITSKGC